MKIDATKRISPESIPDAPDWLPKLLTPLNSFMEQVITGLQGKLTIADNVLSKEIELPFTHGTEKEIANPGFVVRGVIGLYAKSQAISAVKLDYKQSGKIGITVYFQGGAGTDVTSRVRLEA